MVSVDLLSAPGCVRRSSDGFHALAGGPDEASELARDGDHDLVAVQAPGGEPTKARAQTQLGFPRELDHGLRQIGLAPGDHR